MFQGKMIGVVSTRNEDVTAVIPRTSRIMNQEAQCEKFKDRGFPTSAHDTQY